MRFTWRFLLVVGIAALMAASIVLWLSPDPLYHAQEFVGNSRYRAYDRLIRQVSTKHGLDPLLIKAIVWRESAFHPEKVGTSGERGLMQVTERAAADWARAEKIETFVPTDLFDARTNLEVGVWYFSKAWERWKEKDDPIPFALAEYNAGRSRVDRWIVSTNMGDKATAEDLLAVIDFPTTQRYIQEITARYHYYQDRVERGPP
jgi:soluble lytic murein transglycosylase